MHASCQISSKQALRLAHTKTILFTVTEVRCAPACKASDASVAEESKGRSFMSKSTGWPIGMQPCTHGSDCGLYICHEKAMHLFSCTHRAPCHQFILSQTTKTYPRRQPKKAFRQQLKGTFLYLDLHEGQIPNRADP
jgi:hypothetical protein